MKTALQVKEQVALAVVVMVKKITKLLQVHLLMGMLTQVQEAVAQEMELKTDFLVVLVEVVAQVL